MRYNNIRGLDAIIESVRVRILPIFMSTFASIFGLLPLAISTGAGSEFYRGLGSMILGGLAVSTIFTLFLFLSLLAFFIPREKNRVAPTDVEADAS